MAGPFNIKSKPYTLTIEGKPRIFAREHSAPAAGGRYLRPKNWMLVLVIVPVALVATVVVIGAAVAGLIVLRKK